MSNYNRMGHSPYNGVTVEYDGIIYTCRDGWWYNPEGRKITGWYRVKLDDLAAARTHGTDQHGNTFAYETEPLPLLNPEVTA